MRINKNFSKIKNVLMKLISFLAGLDNFEISGKGGLSF